MNGRKAIHLDIEDRIRALDSLPLLEGISSAERRELAEKAHILGFNDGETIVIEGEEGLGFYLILSGGARVLQRGAVINRIPAGGFFGEVSLLEGIPRTADVVADGPTVCLGLLRADFRRLLVREPRIAMTIIEEEGRRLVGGPPPGPLVESPPPASPPDSPPE